MNINYNLYHLNFKYLFLNFISSLKDEIYILDN